MVKGGADSFLAFDGYGPSVSGDNIFDDLGSKPGSSRFGADRPCWKINLSRTSGFMPFPVSATDRSTSWSDFSKRPSTEIVPPSWHFGYGIIDEVVESIEEPLLIGLNDRQVFEPFGAK